MARRKKHKENELETNGAAELQPAGQKAAADGEPTRQLDEQLKKLEEQLRESGEKYMRLRAELDNYRKRMQREAGEIREYAKASTIEEFLSVFDHFQMAMDHVGQASDIATLKQGMQMILGEFRKTFESLGVKPVDATGQVFDPEQHDAVAQEPSSEVEAGRVLRQWKCGYRLGERLLRPATVIVSSGPPQAAASEQGEEDPDESQAETSTE